MPSLEPCMAIYSTWPAQVGWHSSSNAGRPYSLMWMGAKTWAISCINGHADPDEWPIALGPHTSPRHWLDIYALTGCSRYITAAKD